MCHAGDRHMKVSGAQHALLDRGSWCNSSACSDILWGRHSTYWRVSSLILAVWLGGFYAWNLFCDSSRDLCYGLGILAIRVLVAFLNYSCSCGYSVLLCALFLYWTKFDEAFKVCMDVDCYDWATHWSDGPWTRASSKTWQHAPSKKHDASFDSCGSWTALCRIFDSIQNWRRLTCRAPCKH